MPRVTRAPNSPAVTVHALRGLDCRFRILRERFKCLHGRRVTNEERIELGARIRDVEQA